MNDKERVPLERQIKDFKLKIENIDKQEEVKREFMNNLMIYKSKINPLDKMQASNYKWVVNFIGYTKKKKADWREECIDFLKLAIKSHEDYLANVERFSK